MCGLCNNTDVLSSTDDERRRELQAALDALSAVDDNQLALGRKLRVCDKISGSSSPLAAHLISAVGSGGSRWLSGFTSDVFHLPEAG